MEFRQMVKFSRMWNSSFAIYTLKSQLFNVDAIPWHLSESRVEKFVLYALQKFEMANGTIYGTRVLKISAILWDTSTEHFTVSLKKNCVYCPLSGVP